MTMQTTTSAQIRRLASVIILGMAAATTVSFAHAEEASYAQRIACTPDAWRLCSDQIPDADAVKSCMIAKKAQLSAACRATFPRALLASR